MTSDQILLPSVLTAGGRCVPCRVCVYMSVYLCPDFGGAKGGTAKSVWTLPPLLFSNAPGSPLTPGGPKAALANVTPVCLGKSRLKKNKKSALMV